MFHHKKETLISADYKREFRHRRGRGGRTINLAINFNVFCDNNTGICTGNVLCMLCDDRDLRDNEIGASSDGSAFLCDDSNQCNDSNSNMVLSVKNRFYESHYVAMNVMFDENPDLSLLWSVDGQPRFQIDEDKRLV